MARLGVRKEPRLGSRFALLRKLGAGGMGVVYEAFDRELETHVAVKVLRPLDELSLYRFKNEFRSLADVHHPNLLRLGELHREHDQWFFSMELVEGISLLDHVWLSETHPPVDADTVRGRPAGPARVRRLDEGRVRSAFAQLAAAVSAIHAAGFIHRDIKPSNVMVTSEGRVVLLDFGLVTQLLMGEQYTDISVVGTADYMAPEQMQGKPLGPAADWYSFGTVLYQALTGGLPFRGSSYDIIEGKLEREAPPASSVNSEVPADLDSLCRMILARRPAERPSGPQILDSLGLRKSPRAPAPRRAFVGRLKELAAMYAALERSRREGVTLLVQGESGIGKSALVRRFLSSLSSEDATACVLSGRCYEREHLAYKAFDGIIDALCSHLAKLDPVAAAVLLPDDAALLARMFPVLRRVPGMANVPEPATDLPNPLESRRRAFAALRQLFFKLARRQPVVLFIDDFQWADADSLALLRDIVHAPDSPQLLLIATVRTTQDSSALPQADRLHLPPLSSTEARQLISVLAPDATSASADAVATDAAGHPMFIQELVEHLASGAPRATRLDDALCSRIDRLAPQARAILELVAVAGSPMAQRLVASASGLPISVFGEAVSKLRDDHLVRTGGTRGSDTIEPYHDRIREATAANLSAQARAAHHARLALALEQAGVGDLHPLALVRHLDAAGQHDRAAHHALRAARIAADSLAFDQAAQLFETALRIGRGDDDFQRSVRFDLAEALVNAGRSREAADAYLVAAQDAPRDVRLVCQRNAAEQFLISGHVERGLQTLEGVLAEFGIELATTPSRAFLSVVWRRLQVRLRGLRWRSRDEGEIPQRALALLDVYRAAALGLGMVDPIRGADFQARDLLLALRLGERRRVCRSITYEASYLSAQGGRSLPRARRLLERAEPLAQASRDPYLLSWTAGAEGVIRYFEGRFGAAAAQLGKTVTLLREQTIGTNWEISTMRIFHLFALRHMGNARGLRHFFDAYARDSARRGDKYSETTMLRSCAFVHLMEDRPADARALIAQTDWVPPSGRYHLQHWYALRAEREIDLYEAADGRTEGALEASRAGFHALEDSLLTRIQIVRAESRWLWGRMLLAEKRDARRVAGFLEREGTAYARAWAWLLQAASAEPERAQRLLRDAIRACEECDMLLLAAAARRRLGEVMGGEGGRHLAAQADAWMREQGIRNPTRMTAVLAPGFGAR
jgi:serine/threonine protein kinase